MAGGAFNPTVKQTHPVVEQGATQSDILPDVSGEISACHSVRAGCPLEATGSKPVLQFAREKFLAGKTRALLLLVVRLYGRGQDQLDGRSKLHGAQ